MCGKIMPERRFNPASLRDDFEVVTLGGLGRGKGFMVRSRESVFEDWDKHADIIDAVAQRAIRIIEIMIEQGALTDSEMMSRLGLDQNEDRINMLEIQVDKCGEVIRAYRRIVDEVAEKISEALFESLEAYQSESKSRVDLLRFAVGRLVDEYLSLHMQAGG